MSLLLSVWGSQVNKTYGFPITGDVDAPIYILWESLNLPLTLRSESVVTTWVDNQVNQSAFAIPRSCM